MIQFHQIAPCVVPVLAEKVLGNMRRQQIEKNSPVAVLKGVHLVFLFFGLALPQKVQTASQGTAETVVRIPLVLYDDEKNSSSKSDRH